MLLYDINYTRSRHMDTDMALPRRGHRGAVARCTNGAAEYLIWRRNRWVSITADEYRRLMATVRGAES